MKTIVTTIILLISSIVYSQENLRLDNGSLIWQKVYETKSDIKTLLLAVKTERKFSNVDLIDDVIVFDMIDIEPLIKESGFKRMSIPIYLSSNLYAKGKIDIKEGRFRVTVSNIKIPNSPTKLVYSDKLLNESSYEPVSSFILDRNKSISEKFMKKEYYKIYDMTFNSIFDKYTNLSTNDNW
jgi:hypothetical protein